MAHGNVLRHSSKGVAALTFNEKGFYPTYLYDFYNSIPCLYRKQYITFLMSFCFSSDKLSISTEIFLNTLSSSKKLREGSKFRQLKKCCHEGFCPGGFWQGGFCPGVHVLELYTIYLKTHDLLSLRISR